jgi:hypothetical protein
MPWYHALHPFQRPQQQEGSRVNTTVVGLYIHGARSTEPDDVRPTPMLAMPSVDAVEGLGLRQDIRYFRPGDPGRERSRQVSLIDEGTIWRHEAVFGPIDRAALKAQIILAGDVFLPGMLGAVLSFADGAELTLSIMRRPCYAMDLIAPGLKQAMQDGRQGAMARITASGAIRLGQRVTIHQAAEVVMEEVAR